MILFFGNPSKTIVAVSINKNPTNETLEKLVWLFEAPLLKMDSLHGTFIGPRAAMISPWSTNAVEITQNMGVEGIRRIERYHVKKEGQQYDKMLLQEHNDLNQKTFDIGIHPEPIKNIENIKAYNDAEGLALSKDEIKYLKKLSKTLQRPLTDSEVFGFSQVNSEHCRHKIFNGTFIIDGQVQEESLFEMIKKTSKKNPNSIISAYKDNVAFVEGPTISQFAPDAPDRPSRYTLTTTKSVLSLKAETHNFPTTVEPFNGAATGSGGEIRDRMAGGQGAIPLAGTAVYMTPYSRVTENRPWENAFPARPWKYQTPLEILIKASNGASDFGNKFGQPLIAGSLFTFEHHQQRAQFGYDKVIMLAGGIGMGKMEQAQKKKPNKGDCIVILGGDNYRIGMGGAAVSSTETGAYDNTIELNAIQRSNPEMQKRVANVVRALVEANTNPIVSIHDHGAGGHLNCLSELVEDTGGIIVIDALPIGDPTLSVKEIIGNESQERMGLIISPTDLDLLKNIAKRERAPLYVVGEVTDDLQFTFVDNRTQSKPMDLKLEALFGSTPKTILEDKTLQFDFKPLTYDSKKIHLYLKELLKLEAVACKDWLTNKVDRCVTGRVAQQQTVGTIQLPLSNCGVVGLDYSGKTGIATAIGHAPLSALIDPGKGSVVAIAESLTNIIWAPLEGGLAAVSLSANWMWPCKNPGEDARLYKAVQACANFAIALGINIPTGKDSLSMKQQYENQSVKAPGTVIISAAGACSDISKIVTPDLKPEGGSLFYINLSGEKSSLGGSAFAQVLNQIGDQTHSVADPVSFKRIFNRIQELIIADKILAGHDIGSGGLITTLLEMCFPCTNLGMKIDFNTVTEEDTVALLFAENVGIVIQSREDLTAILKKDGIACYCIGNVETSDTLSISHSGAHYTFAIPKMRDQWFATSAALDAHQTHSGMAQTRFENYKKQPLQFKFPKHFNGALPKPKAHKLKAAVIREQGSNSEREMAYMMHLTGFEVIDVHMTDLISGKETLEDVRLLVAVGGFSNSDVLGSAKGWAGSFLYNPTAKARLNDFFNRPDTLSLGVCNGCQLFVALGLITPDHTRKPKMAHNDSGKFECHFTAVRIQKSSAIMLRGMEDSILGIWAAHGEGKFVLPEQENAYEIPAKYHYDSYPANPNGSDYNAAMLASANGRHLVMMPHLERAIYPWNWAYYPSSEQHEVSPWITVFENAVNWLQNQQ